MGKNKIVTRKKIGKKEITITSTYNRLSDGALKNLANGIKSLYSKKVAWEGYECGKCSDLSKKIKRRN